MKHSEIWATPSEYVVAPREEGYELKINIKSHFKKGVLFGFYLNSLLCLTYLSRTFRLGVQTFIQMNYNSCKKYFSVLAVAQCGGESEPNIQNKSVETLYSKIAEQ